MPTPETPPLDSGSWEVQRRQDGAVLVRVRSRPYRGQPLPDAVFTFRFGDPQFDFWAARLSERSP